jgi:hypothetical protein
LPSTLDGKGNIMTISPRTLLVCTMIVGIVGLDALPVAAAYAVLLVPISFVNHMGGLFYFVLVSAVAGGAVGVLTTGCAQLLLPQARLRTLAAIGLFAAVIYFAVAFYSRSDLPGPGWWTPLTDVVAFAIAIAVTGLFAARRRSAHAI